MASARPVHQNRPGARASTAPPRHHVPRSWTLSVLSGRKLSKISGHGTRGSTFGCQFEGAKGAVVGPVLVDEEATRSLGGAELEAWFSGQGAEHVQVVG
ncbi:hypothetical protein ACWER9_26575 [Micromonospora sp. NPDC003944]